jgi:hypothetical protein
MDTREHFERLVARSSLGAPAARRIRSYATAREVRSLIDGGEEETLGFTEKYVEEIRLAVQAASAVLEEARERRDAVLRVASGYEGVLRTFCSGSVAHRTVIKPVSDADCGVVLDRRTHSKLGPDGDGVGPSNAVQDVLALLRNALTEEFPSVRVSSTKRAIQVSFDDVIGDDEDPSVDLIVALTRSEADGLWIPNLESNTWDASHPERHTELFTQGQEELKRIRRRAIRLAKAWNKQYESPSLSSFNIEALAIECVQEDMGIVEALLSVFEFGAKQLATGLTPDPAGVSPPIKVGDRETAMTRLRAARDGVTEALEHDEDEQDVREALSRVFFEFIDAPGRDSKTRFAASVRKGAAVLGPVEAPRLVRAVRSHGKSR